ncbi:MAG: Kelch repeat-containing protein, partial [Gemmatimonadales bacterium]
MLISGTDPGPGARYGHAAAYDASSRQMYVFGGSSSFRDDPANSQVKVFTFDDASFASGTWSTLAVTGGPPAPRRDHTLVLDPNDSALFVFSGYLNPTTWSNALWKLDLRYTPAVWSIVGAGGDVPAPRAGHAAYYDNQVGAGRLFIFGGEPTSATPLDEFAYTIDPLAPSPVWVKGAPAAARLSGQTMAVDAMDPLAAPYARVPEIYTPGAGGAPGSWALQTNSGLLSRLSVEPVLYPLQFVVPGTSIPGGGGRLMQVGPDIEARYLDLPASGLAGGWQTVQSLSTGFNPWSAVMYEPGKILIAGGKQVNTTVGWTRTLDATGTLAWQSEPDMVPRYDHTLLMLPTGQVLATGGRDFLTSKYCPQIWTPGQGWTGPTALACDGAKREYHSSALLLADGRVLTGGGGDDLFLYPDSRKLRLYCPPYLFNAQNNVAVRPVIASAPSDLTWGQSFTIGTPDPGSVQKVCLMRPGAVTHSFDQNGRYVPLPIQGRVNNPPRLCVTAPASPDDAPPGDYLLFILGSADGPDVPSIARWVRLSADVGDLVPPGTIAELTPEIVGSSEVWFSWTATADDGQLPASGAARDFDLRYSYLGPINGGPSWDLASWAQCEPTPGPHGTWHEYTLNNLQSCTTYHFALRPRDDNANLSGFHDPVSVQTMCGGGGGGGFAARPAE